MWPTSLCSAVSKENYLYIVQYHLRFQPQSFLTDNFIKTTCVNVNVFLCDPVTETNSTTIAPTQSGNKTTSTPTTSTSKSDIGS